MTAAALKRDERHPDDRELDDTFRGLMTAAALKRVELRDCSPRSLAFRGLMTAAALKRPGCAGVVYGVVSVLPRSDDRGRIEAAPVERMSPDATNPLPRSDDRGRIEAEYSRLPRQLRPILPRSDDRGRIEAVAMAGMIALILIPSAV